MMPDRWQIWAVAGVVLAALIYLIVRFFGKGGGGGAGCGKCSS